MIYFHRLQTNLVWLALMSLFALIIVRPDVAGISHVAVLCGWVVMIIAFLVEWVLLGECMTADIGKDQTKRVKAIAFLREVNAGLAEAGRFRRIRGDFKLYSLALLIAFTGNVFLALMFIVLRLMRVLGEYTAARVVEEYDNKATTTNIGDTGNDFTPTPPAAR